MIQGIVNNTSRSLRELLNLKNTSGRICARAVWSSDVTGSCITGSARKWRHRKCWTGNDLSNLPANIQISRQNSNFPAKICNTSRSIREVNGTYCWIWKIQVQGSSPIGWNCRRFSLVPVLTLSFLCSACPCGAHTLYFNVKSLVPVGWSNILFGF
jgi:hypothetical protein